MLRGQQSLRARLGYNAVKQHPGGIVFYEALAILGECGVIPRLGIHRHANKPAKQQVVTELLCHQALAANAIEQLEHQRPKQFLRRNGLAPALGIHHRECRVHVFECCVQDVSNRAQRMIPGHKTIETSHREQRILHYIGSTHVFSPDQVPCSYDNDIYV